MKPKVPDPSTPREAHLKARNFWLLGPDLRIATIADSPLDQAMKVVFSLFQVEQETHQEVVSLTLDAQRDPHAGGWIVYASGQPIYRTRKDNQLVPSVEGLVTHLFSRTQVSQLVLHTGMVERNGQGILIPGDRGSGKSTLTLWLARSGARYFGDDLLMFDANNGLINAFPKAVTLKQGSFSCFEETDTHDDALRGPIRYLLPSTAGLHQLPFENLAMIVFPEYDQAAGTPQRLAPAWTALALVQQLLGGVEWSDQALSLVARLADIPSYFLPYRDLGEAEAFIRSLPEKEVSHATLS